MASAETTVERLRKFLRELRRERTLLVGELERSVLRGEDMSLAVTSRHIVDLAHCGHDQA